MSIVDRDAPPTYGDPSANRQRAAQTIAASNAVSQQAWAIWRELNAGNQRAAAFRARMEAGL